MANSKLFRATQNRSIGLGDSKDGYFGFTDAVNAIKRTQVKKCEPYNFLLNVAKKLKTKRADLYVKILFSNSTGQIKLSVRIGKNKDAATNGKNCYFVLGNILSDTIVSVTPTPKNVNESAIDEKNKLKRDSLPETGTNRNRRKNALRFRKKVRRVPSRARLKKNRTKKSIKQPDVLVVKDFNETGAPAPAAFNTKSAAIPKKDFSSIFEDANSRLYDDNSQDDIQIENPPGVAKFIGLGVDIDRPSIIASTEMSPIIFDASLDVYGQALLDKKFKIESAYKRLAKVDEEDITAMLETLEEYRALTDDAITSTSVIAILDEQLVEKISLEMQALANQLGFNSALKLSQIYVQAMHDLGGVGVTGVYETENDVRTTSVKGNEINIDESYDTRFFDGSDIKQKLFRGRQVDAADPTNYQFGNFGTFLGYYHQIDPPQLRTPEGGSTSLGDSGISVMQTSNARLPGLMQAIYYELLLSKLLTSGDSNVKFLADNGYRNIIRSFLGQFSDPRTSLNDIRVPEKMAAIAKFNSANENYYPLEQFISAGDGLNGRTFLDAVIQPAIGSIIEDSDPNFDLLNAWTEKTRNSLDEFFKYIDAAFTDGGAPIVYNEIVLAFIKCVTDRTAKIGSRSHPKSTSMSRKNSNLDSGEIALILHMTLDEITSNQNLIAHIYNTFGYSFFKDQGALAKALGDQMLSGLKTDQMSKKIQSYAINKNNWNPNTTRAINDREDVSKILNNAYEELARFFNILENNLMTSIGILLSDAGLIGLSEAPEYNTLADGFFVTKSATVRGDDRARTSGNPGTYEATAFSGIPRIYIRTLLCMCAERVSKQSGSWLRVDINGFEKLVKAAKVAVENVDPDLGPLRWKVTHGQWPPESGDLDDLTPDDYNKLVPDIVKTARSGEVDVDIETDSDGTPTSINVNDPAEGWEFIDSKEGFCPLTLFLDGEDNSEVNLNLVRANRALFDNHYDALVTNRSRIYTLKQLLEKPLTAFQAFPQDLEEATGKVSLDSLKQLAELPGIDGQEIIKFTSPNQIGNMRKSVKLESPSETLRYLPNKLATSNREYNVARRFVDDYLEKTFSFQAKTIIQTVGIPAGLLAAEKMVKSTFSLTRDAEFMFFPNIKWSAKLKKFNASIYLIPGSFANCDDQSSFSEIVNNAKYFIANESIGQLMSYTEVKDYLNLTSTEALEILTNHCIDYALQLTLKITTGADFSEDTFRINGLVKNLLLTKDGQDGVETLIDGFPEAYKSIFKNDSLESTQSIVKKLQDSTVAEINSFIGALNCRLLSPEDMAVNILGPRMFDRVFNIFANPDEHYATSSARGLTRVNKIFDGEQKTAFIINLKDDGDNSIRNDHFASYYYKVEKL